MVTSVSAAMPNIASAVLVEENQPIPVNYTFGGYIREVRSYDLRRRLYLYRYDLFDGKTQLGVDVMVSANKENDINARKQAIEMLINDAKKELDLNNLIKLVDCPELETKYI